MYIYSMEEIEKIDRLAEQQGFSLFSLMENAGRGIAEKLLSHIKKEDHVLILAGKGNNGGDGIVIARYLLQVGYQVTLTFPLGEPKTKTANSHLDYFLKQGYSIQTWHNRYSADVLVDAMLGIGVRLPLRKNVVNLIQWYNAQNSLKVAIDIPSGVQTNNGTVVQSCACQADITFSLHGAKPSAFLLSSSTFFGEVYDIDIGLKQTSNMRVISKKMVRESFPKRKQALHKGSFGTSFLVAGSDEMPGSALLAAIGAIRSGTGKLIIGTTKHVASVIPSIVPEATYMHYGLIRVGEGEVPKKIAAAGIGPGLTDSDVVAKAVNELMKLDIPLVLDAGALQKRSSWKREHVKSDISNGSKQTNQINQLDKPHDWNRLKVNAPLVLTPHPGEFSKLMGVSVKEIQVNRIELARQFAIENDVILILKGQYTVIAFPDGDILINPTGNTGLAKGGSGDVLTGMLVSMLSYYPSPEMAVINAVYLHGLCAEKWTTSNSEASMTASDFYNLIPQVFHQLEGTEI